MYTEENNQGIFIEKQVRVPTFTMTYEHSHIFCEVFYLKTGSCIYSLNDAIYHLSAGDIFIVIPGDSHCTRYEGLIPCERIVVYCDLNIIPQDFWRGHGDILRNLSRSGKVIPVKDGRKQLETLLERMLEENNQPDEFSSEFLLLQMMTLLLSIQRNGIFVYEQIRPKNGISTDIEDALRFIAQNFSLPLSLEEVASAVSLSPTYLSKKFKKITGVSFKEYLNYIRIHQASRMLITTDDTITQIATGCGFNSSNYFKDCFRKVNGMSPRAFRQRLADSSFEYELDRPIHFPLDKEDNC